MTTKENRFGPKAEPTPRCECTPNATRYQRQLRLRRAASYRLHVLESGRSDPWHYPPPTRGYPEAAQHLLECGLTPAPNQEALQAMRKHGGRSFRAAKLIAERWEAA